MPPKKDVKIVNFIRAFEKATNAKVISVEPTPDYVTVYWKEKSPDARGGWKYGTFGFKVK